MTIIKNYMLHKRKKTLRNETKQNIHQIIQVQKRSERKTEIKNSKTKTKITNIRTRNETQDKKIRESISVV